jgi:hypothetical protein
MDHSITSREQLINSIKKRFSFHVEYPKIELDNLDWIELVLSKEGDLVVENEHGTQFNLDELSDSELQIINMLV